MGELGVALDERGARSRLERLEGLANGLEHLHAEDFLQHRAIEPFDEAVGLRRPALGAAVLDGVELEIELVGMLFDAAEFAASG